MPNYRIFRWLHRQLRETRSFYVTRYDVGRQRTVRTPSLEESISNVAAVRPDLSTRAVDPHVCVSHQTVWRVLNENRLHRIHFQRVQALNLAGYLLRLPVDSTIT
ncbi:uncharacterized protein TNCV_2516251 [Trichonephila clavipes]|nr:uncharacterized protein TNCV_2516251 [Trichonephila clavipes]